MMTKIVGNPVGFDPSKPVQTRDGRKVEILRTPASLNIAFIEDENNPSKWVLRTFHKNGSFLHGYTSGDDLVNCPPTKVRKEGWILVFPHIACNYTSTIGRQSGIYKSFEDAKTKADKHGDLGYEYPVAIAKVEWEEEQ